MNSVKKQKIFNYISILIIIILSFYYLGRLIYFKYLNNDNIVYSDLLAERIKQSINKYELNLTLIEENNIYSFTNNSKNNYIKFMGYMWRIIKINEDNSITITTTDILVKLEEAKINNWLNEFKNTLNLSYLKDETITNLNDNSSNELIDIQPVINLKSTTPIYQGSGTIDNPYIIMENNFETLNDIFVGHYLYLNDNLWKVVSKENDKIKLVSDDYLKVNGSNYETDLNTLLKYLNTEYYNNFKEKELIKENFNNDLKIGLLNIDEMFAYELKNTFTLSNIDETNVYIIDETNNLYLDSIESNHYARPSLYIKNAVKIKEGNGTYLSPFILGGTNEEVNNHN